MNRPQALTQRADHLWTVDDEVPGLPLAGRRMSVVRRRDGRLLFYNAIPVPEDTLRALRELGPPAQLVLPNQFHALDAAAFALKLNLTTYAPAPAVTALAARLPCRPIDELPTDDGLRVVTVEGFRTREVALVVDGTLLVADLLTNVPHAGGPVGWMMRLVGFTGPAPRLPKPVRKRVEVDTGQVRALFDRLADQPLTRVIPSHGDLVEGDVAAVLRRVGAAL